MISGTICGMEVSLRCNGRAICLVGNGRSHLSGEESQLVGGRSPRGVAERLLGGGSRYLGGG